MLTRLGIQWLEDNPTNPSWSYVYQSLLREVLLFTEQEQKTLTRLGIQWLEDNPTNPSWSYVYQPLLQEPLLFTEQERKTLTRLGIQWLQDNPTNLSWSYVYQPILQNITWLNSVEQNALIDRGLQWLRDFPSHQTQIFVVMLLLEKKLYLSDDQVHFLLEKPLNWLVSSVENKEWVIVFEKLSQHHRLLSPSQRHTFIQHGLDWLSDRYGCDGWHIVFVRLSEQREWFTDEQRSSLLHHGLKWLDEFFLYDKWYTVYGNIWKYQKDSLNANQRLALFNGGIKWLNESPKNPKWYVVYRVLLQRETENPFDHDLISMGISWIGLYGTIKSGSIIYVILMESPKLNMQERERLASLDFNWIQHTNNPKEWVEAYQGFLIWSAEHLPGKHRDITSQGLVWLKEHQMAYEWVLVYQIVLRYGEMERHDYDELVNTGIQWLTDNLIDQRWNYIYQALLAQNDLPDATYKVLVAKGIHWLETYKDNVSWVYIFRALLQTSDRMLVEDRKQAQKIGLNWLETHPQHNRRSIVSHALKPLIDLSDFQIGDVVTGQVTVLGKNGAHVHIGQVEGLLPLSKITHHHIKHPREVLAIGDEVTVRIDKIDLNNKKIYLNRRDLLPDPFDSFVEHYHIGDIVHCTVMSFVDYGIFILIDDTSVDGLLHKSEMLTLGEDHPSTYFKKSDKLQVRLISIDAEKCRIAVSLDVLPEHQWKARQQQGQ